MRDVYPKFADFERHAIPASEARDGDDLPERDKALVEWVWNRYGKYSAAELRRRTHAEKPWKEARGKTPLDEPSGAPIKASTMEAFFRDLAATFAGLGQVRLSTLSLDGNAVAMTLSFETAGATYLYNSGYDPEEAKLAVGLVSKALAVRDAIALGKRRFDFLRGDEDYKRRLGGVDRGVVTLTLRTD